MIFAQVKSTLSKIKLYEVKADFVARSQNKVIH